MGFKWKHPKPTLKQQMAVDNILSPEFKNIKKAMMDAGYSEETASVPKSHFRSLRGVEAYLAKLDQKARMKFNASLRDVVMDKYMEGLEATKSIRLGEEGVERPDHATRKQFLDKFSEFFGWSSQTPPTQPGQQYNFFMFDKEQRHDFNDKFKEFLRGYYAK